MPIKWFMREFGNPMKHAERAKRLQVTDRANTVASTGANVEPYVVFNDPRYLFGKFIGAILCTVAAWWIWTPLGAYLAILNLGGYGARLIQRSSLFWSPIGYVIAGSVWGLFMASMTCLLASCAVTSWWAKTLFVLWGLIAVAYVGFPVQSGPFLSSRQDKLSHAQILAIFSYLAASVIVWIFLWHKT